MAEAINKGQIQEAFEGFLAHAYGLPHGLASTQLLALKDAFYGGALTGLTLTRNPQEEIEAYMAEVVMRFGKGTANA